VWKLYRGRWCICAVVETGPDQAADVGVAVEKEKAAASGGFDYVEVSSGGF